MIEIALLGLSPAEETLGTIFAVALGCWLAVMALRKIRRKSVPPDPWDAETASALENPDTHPICHRCLSPHPVEVYFCPDCGASVGTYTNWLPFPQIFSLGHMLRIGTSGQFKVSAFSITFFVLIGFYVGMVVTVLFTVIYWIVFLVRLIGGNRPSEIPDAPHPPTKPLK